jgi:hypothetical protein
MPRDDCGRAVGIFGKSAFFGVEAKITFAAAGIGSVAMKTVLRKDGQDLPAEIHRSAFADGAPKWKKKSRQKEGRTGSAVGTHTERVSVPGRIGSYASA